MQLLAHLADAHEVAVEGCQCLRLPGQVVCAVHVRRLCGEGAVHQASHNHLQSAPQPVCTGLLSHSISATSQPLLSIDCHRKPCLGTLCHASLKGKGRQSTRISMILLHAQTPCMMPTLHSVKLGIPGIGGSRSLQPCNQHAQRLIHVRLCLAAAAVFERGSDISC